MVNIAWNVLVLLKKFETDALETSPKRVIQKTTEATTDLIGNKIANRITKVSKNLQQSNSETVIIEHDREIPKVRRYISQAKDKKLLMI